MKGYKALYALKKITNLMLSLFVDPMSHGELGCSVLFILLVLVYESNEKPLSDALSETSVSVLYLLVLGRDVSTRTDFFPDLRVAVFLQSAVLCAVYLLHVVHQYHFKSFLVTDL